MINHDNLTLFHSINHSRRGATYRNVLLNPGLSQSDIAAITGESRQTIARTLNKLEAGGLLTTVIDGVHSRYYSTTLLPEGAEAFYKQSREFSEFIMKRLENEGGKPPTTIKKGLDRMLVEMGYASDRFAMEIGINPFMTCNLC
ncbi:MAG: MarR family transcriptional regulator [Thermoplasmata archaeon]